MISSSPTNCLWGKAQNPSENHSNQLSRQGEHPPHHGQFPQVTAHTDRYWGPPEFLCLQPLLILLFLLSFFMVDTLKSPLVCNVPPIHTHQCYLCSQKSRHTFKCSYFSILKPPLCPPPLLKDQPSPSNHTGKELVFL